MDSEKTATGEFNNVFLSAPELAKLRARFGAEAVRDYIERMSHYLNLHPRKKYKSCYSALDVWMRRDNVPQIQPFKAKPKPDLEFLELRISGIHKMFSRDFERGLRFDLPTVEQIREMVLKDG